MFKKITRGIGIATAAFALMFSVAACSSDSDDKGAADKNITLGIIPSWTDGLATAYLWKNILEDEGYTVKITEIAEAAPLYTGLSKGDIDIYPSAWSEVTHADYMKKYGNDLEDLGAYYEGAGLFLAVPDYSDAKSIADLPDNAAKFNNKIVGIEAGAGLTRATKEDVMPAYKLNEAGFELVESSTTAMLAELKRAVERKQDIVVTLWAPFWANSEFPVRPLEDPKTAFGELEDLHAIATAGFAKKHPEVADLFANFKLDGDAFGSLEALVTAEEWDGDPAGAVQAWLDENPDFVAGLKG
ncbi:MAG: glycine betaine ABC transporter substrate-binding protein [Actinomycetales bacterium]|nr:glycine betaine ABC transporter substrate-binding protein [Actinomycetales bacterium]